MFVQRRFIIRKFVWEAKTIVKQQIMTNAVAGMFFKIQIVPTFFVPLRHTIVLTLCLLFTTIVVFLSVLFADEITVIGNKMTM